ncbi:MAG: TetR/AcrR family transcriptional regulator [Pseudonocardiales bacterium]|nr:TetR/AcrR family transcriptional regulator [Pseudonocardiales bacterium]
MARPKLHDEALRVRLVEQAVRTLSEDGLEGLRLRKLAAHVGTSTTAVYSLFGGKPGLLEALFDEAFTRFRRRLAEVELTGDAHADLLVLGLAYRASALAEPHFYQVMFGPVGGAVTPGPESVQRAEGTFLVLVDAVRRAIDAGQLRQTDPITIATALWACVHGLVSLELRSLLPLPPGDAAELYHQTLRAMADGWRA